MILFLESHFMRLNVALTRAFEYERMQAQEELDDYTLRGKQGFIQARRKQKDDYHTREAYIIL